MSVEKSGNAQVVRVWIPSIAHAGILRRMILYVAFSFTALAALPFCRGTKITWAMSPNYVCMIPATVVKWSTGTKVIHDVVDIWPNAVLATGYSFPKVILKVAAFVCRVSYALSDLVVTISESMKSSLTRTVSGRVPIRVLENCVGDEFFMIPAKDGSEPFRVTFLGSLSPSNDFSSILQAATKLEEAGVRFTIAGSGELAGTIFRSIRDNRITNVDFDGLPIKHEDVPAVLSEADVLVIPLRSGFGDTSFPSKLSEYMASGRPVICASDGELYKEIAAEGIAATFHPGNSSALIDEIRKLQNSSSLRKKLVDRGREYARQHLSKQSFEDRIDEIVQTAMNLDRRF